MISRSSNVMINRGASVGFPLVTGISGAPPPRGYCDDLFKKKLGIQLSSDGFNGIRIVPCTV